MHSAPAHPTRAQRTGAPEWLLQTRGLAGQRGDRTLFADLALSLAPGSVTWLRGRNGRGKTSLLRLLAGLAAPAAGSISINGRTLQEAGPVWRRQFVYIAHQNALKEDLSASEALRFLAQVHGVTADEPALAQALDRMGIANRRHAAVRTLSQGQRRRVALARLVLHADSPVWLLDEPFDALDTAGIEALNRVIAAHAARGGCVLLTSHQALTLSDPTPTVFDLDAAAPSQRAVA